MGNRSSVLAYWIISTLALAAPAPAAAGQQPAAASHAQDASKPRYQAKYRVIDVHVHGGEPREEAVAAQIEVMDRARIAAAVNLDGGRSDGTLAASIELEKKHAGRFVTFAKFTKKDFARVREAG